jgi:hypothetical protein
MNIPSDREGVLTAYAEMIPLDVELNRLDRVAIELVVKGVRGGEIGNDLPAIIAIARRLRGERRNQITDLVETARELS